jgi:hypothetical protein
MRVIIIIIIIIIITHKNEKVWKNITSVEKKEVINNEFIFIKKRTESCESCTRDFFL